VVSDDVLATRGTKILEDSRPSVRIELRGVAGAVDVHRIRFDGDVAGD
jgi:hypothetical protein